VNLMVERRSPSGNRGKSRRTGKNGDQPASNRSDLEDQNKTWKAEVRSTKLYHVDEICMSVLLPALIFALISRT
jgi:hypothetical protein